MKTNKQYPLILVFYLDRDLLSRHEVRNIFAKSVDEIIKEKKFNAIAFFLPTDGEDRIECINPVMVKEADMEKINKLVEDISTEFSLKEKLDNIFDYDIQLKKPE